MNDLPVDPVTKMKGRSGDHLSVDTPPVSTVSRSSAREAHRLVLGLVHMEW